MNRIHLLSEQVANQIAAGEVVERPASVVKELVENSLDAQSRRILVEVQAGGRSLIRVTDDGVGMSRDDALLCLERHATSKIRRAEDLAAIDTMGFRGEALPSIASVSRMTLTTREVDPAVVEATQILINGGKLLEVRAAGSPPGTSLEVRQLFFNLPARRKFLRSEETESVHIHHYLTLVALAHPSVSFTFIRDGRTIWQLPAVLDDASPAGRMQGLIERHRGLFGKGASLLPLDYTSPLWEPAAADADEPAAPQAASLRLWGLIGPPGTSRSTRQDQHLFVNRRPVENRGLNFALVEGYHTALMKGQYPVATLFLEIDPAQVDVNIHPAKREVKFHYERAVRQVVAEAVRKTLREYHQGVSARPGVGPGLASTPQTVERQQSEGSPSLHPASVPGVAGNSPRSGENVVGAMEPVGSPKTVPWAGKQEEAGAHSERGTVSPPPSASETSKPSGVQQHFDHAVTLASAPAASGTLSGAPMPLLHVPLRLVGVVGKLYVVLESDRGLVLLDQHAAHERILFEQMLQRMETQAEAPLQRLLLPETVELSAPDAQFLKEQLPTLTRMGVGLSEFGERTFLLEGLPPFVKMTEPRQFILGLLDELKAAGDQVNTLRLGETTIAKTVCRHAVKANDPLAEAELQNLVDDLRRCVMPYTCPHGRPTLIEMNYRELEKKFGRVQ